MNSVTLSVWRGKKADSTTIRHYTVSRNVKLRRPGSVYTVDKTEHDRGRSSLNWLDNMSVGSPRTVHERAVKGPLFTFPQEKGAL